MIQPKREIPPKERRGVHKLITKHCANYACEYGYLPLECECYMFGKWYTGAFCEYFEQAVLPLDPLLQCQLQGRPAATKPCAVCNSKFVPASNRQKYCCEACKVIGRRAVDRERDKRRKDTPDRP